MSDNDEPVKWTPRPETPEETAFWESDGPKHLGKCLADYAVSFQPPVPVCPKCHRPDCAMLATVIVGRRGWFEGFVECAREQRRRALAAEGITDPRIAALQQHLAEAQENGESL